MMASDLKLDCIELKCAQCGGPLKKVPSKNKLVCEYCDTTYIYGDSSAPDQDNNEKKRHTPLLVGMLLVFVLAISISSTLMYFNRSNHTANQPSAHMSEPANAITAETIETPADILDPVLSDLDYVFFVDDSYNYCYTLTNPNKTYSIVTPTVIITARDSAGHIIDVEEHTMGTLTPGDSLSYSNMISSTTNDFTLEYTISYDSYYEGIADPVSTDFEVVNLYKTDPYFTGEVISHYSENIERILITGRAYKDGDLVGIFETTADNLTPKGSVPFEAYYMGSADYDTMYVSVQKWHINLIAQ